MKPGHAYHTSIYFTLGGTQSQDVHVRTTGATTSGVRAFVAEPGHLYTGHIVVRPASVAGRGALFLQLISSNDTHNVQGGSIGFQVK